MCFVTNPLQEKTRALPRNSQDPRAGKGGREEPHRPIRQGAGQVVISPQMFPRLLPSKRKLNITLPLTYAHTKGKKEMFFEAKRNSGSIFEDKSLFMAAKVLVFTPYLWQLYKTWRDLSRGEMHSLVIT